MSDETKQWVVVARPSRLIPHEPVKFGIATSAQDEECDDLATVSWHLPNPGDPKVRTQKQAEEIAQRIVRAVNSHEALVKAVRLSRAALGMHGPCKNNSCGDCKAAWDAQKAALKLAEAP